MDFFDFQKKLTDQKKQSEPQALTVSQLTTCIQGALENAFPKSVRVVGEISNFKAHGPSGHLYFTLKDSGACIDCVMFKSDAEKLKFAPGEGMEVILTGRVALYPQRGRYQLYVSRIEPKGEGALQLALRQLHDKLKAKGLFEPSRKRPIPKFPLRIAMVTSTQTAAIADMLKVLRRFPFLTLQVFHVPVQGAGASKQIADAILSCSQLDPMPEVILLARGGGSLEDLWEFNEEVVANAIARSPIPVITGIGHEIDVSIADLVADHHAHTPTEAAQVATRFWRTAKDNLEAQGIRLRREIRTRFESERARLGAIERHPVFKRPTDRIKQAFLRLDDRRRALDLSLAGYFKEKQAQLTRLMQKLHSHRPSREVELRKARLARAAERFWKAGPQKRIELGKLRLQSLQQRLTLAFQVDLKQRRKDLDQFEAQLNALGPSQVLARGYSITRMKKSGKIVRDAGQVHDGDKLKIQLADGEIEATADDPRQPKLF